jgi:hypothetical protein
MGLITRRWAQLRWLTVPIAAYLVVTLALPAANGAARDAAFLRHTGWLLGGCVAIVALALAASVAADVGARAARFVNRRRADRVTRAGGSP